MASDCKLVKAALLGGFATSSVLCFCLTLAGATWLFVGLCYLDDDKTGPGSYVPSATFALSAGVSCLLSCGFGWRVGRDWYRNGR